MNVINDWNDPQYIQIIYGCGVFTQGNQYFPNMFMFSFK